MFSDCGRLGEEAVSAIVLGGARRAAADISLRMGADTSLRKAADRIFCVSADIWAASDNSVHDLLRERSTQAYIT